MHFDKLDERDRFSARAIAIGISAASLACGGVAADDDDDVGAEMVLGATTQALGMYDGMWRRWPSGSVPYCYQPSHPDSNYPAPGSLEYEDTVQLTEDAIAQYNALPYSSLNFHGGELCPNWDAYEVGTDPSTLRIVITDDDAATRSCPEGSLDEGVEEACVGFPPADREIVIMFGEAYSTNHQAAEAGILHELGHALGFRHEDDRRAGTENDCNPDPSFGGGAQHGDASITVYDAYSVMNATYCHWNPYLSAIDIAGLTHVYPAPTADRITVPFSFQLSNGVLTGAGSSALIEFANRVAGVWAFHFEDAVWTKVVSGGTQQVGTGSSVTLAAALGSGTSQTIRAHFNDVFGRLRFSPDTFIQRNPGLATAIVLSSL